ncbi:DNA-binding protein [Halostella sp. JP-L12]|uniref:helix-turn-helix domain-containing protein n=1 Tax=Halostella TaxID=1843185 RepID=UPI000EF79DB3|nr:MULTISPECIES: helix-turn-helix domain-containing protein [Halostella]NHN47935.1 DNA-binding protein [Halostella sp. JP-L12]
MQYLRMTARPSLEAIPRTLRLLLASEHVARARWISWNLSDSRGLTVLLRVAGDRGAVRDGLSDAPEVVTADVAPAESGAFYLLITLDPTVSTVTASIFEVIRRDGVVLLPPVADRDGAVEVRLVGEPAAVGDVVDALPDDIDVVVREIGERGLLSERSTASLSPRQREAVTAAIDLGYYDQPRKATHEEVAEALGCAPSTASEHIRKAEAKLVRAAVERGRWA